MGNRLSSPLQQKKAEACANIGSVEELIARRDLLFHVTKSSLSKGCNKCVGCYESLKVMAIPRHHRSPHKDREAPPKGAPVPAGLLFMKLEAAPTNSPV